MTNHSPRISIGLAVYNGETYLQETLDSILEQTFTDFELIISDNASTDRTVEICQDYAARDSRIRFYQNDRNRGACWNQNRVYELARGEYYKLAAHDDLCAPTFLARCVEVLDQHPDVVVCYPQTLIINEQGEIQTQYPDGKLIGNPNKHARPWQSWLSPLIGDGQLHLDSPCPSVRFRDIVCELGKCHPIFGLIRVSALKQTPGLQAYSHADGVLLARLALLGTFYQVPEVLFFSREHPQQSSQRYRNRQKGGHDYHAYNVWWNPDNASKLCVPTWKIFSEFCLAAAESPITIPGKLGCYFAALRWLRGNWRSLLSEVQIVLRQQAGRRWQSWQPKRRSLVSND
ncbi:glycosyltransferase family 2 protein [Thermocoleostomius sinensis]|uniref:Glycosyltransferase family A protein n=1 Tax=Thermocoleostomius sinensis A174 TaxID=2016057 RepID=A0A9E8ZGB0_9CYAN|nr:glycosyltransferase family A protein [Thermocoleostomius sinensis]WAL62608.1 glycosyltransferase family A protein [Thermocoleostomius sinensis A174]